MYTDATRERMLFPTRTGPMEDATHHGALGREGEGPYILIWLRVENGLVKRAAWSSNGCPAMMASASAIAELSEGKDASNLTQISPEDVTALIGELPEGKQHAPAQAIAALLNAIGGT